MGGAFHMPFITSDADVAGVWRQMLGHEALHARVPGGAYAVSPESLATVRALTPAGEYHGFGGCALPDVVVLPRQGGVHLS